MKKVGLLSVLMYLFILLSGIYCLIEGLMLLEDLSQGKYEGMGYPMDHVLGIILIVISLVCLFFKFLHGITGFAIFSIPCMLIEAACVYFIWTAFVLESGNTPYQTGAFIFCTIPQTVAFISNARSLVRRQ